MHQVVHKLIPQTKRKVREAEREDLWPALAQHPESEEAGGHERGYDVQAVKRYMKVVLCVVRLMDLSPWTEGGGRRRRRGGGEGQGEGGRGGGGGEATEFRRRGRLLFSSSSSSSSSRDSPSQSKLE